MTAADRDWFSAHPGKRRYAREITPAEITDLQQAGLIPEVWNAAGLVTVTELAPGVRARSFEGVRLYASAGVP